MKGHYNVLTDEQVAVFNERFRFTDLGDGILVKTVTYNRVVYHDKEHSFQAIANVGEKKITVRVCPLAMSLWDDLSIREKNTLIEIQNAVNKAIRNDNSMEIEFVKKYLKI